MRIVRKLPKTPVREIAGSTQPSGETGAGTKTVQLGIEDALLVLVVAILLYGWGTKQLTIEQLLAYLGVSTTGGIWGLIGGASSDT
jgi:hypothetical protein